MSGIIQKTFIVAVFFSLLIVASVLAHGVEGSSPQADLVTQSVQGIMYAGAIVIVLALVSIFTKDKLSERLKHLFFIIIVIAVVAATGFLAWSTINLNLNSATGGPVHWHADFEVWNCGSLIELRDPEGITNRVGSSTFHEHNDNRIHVEGVVVELEDVALHNFFEFVGGGFTKTSLELPTNDGVVSVKQGDLCNGRPGQLRMYVNGARNMELDDYVLSPYSTVPPGDMIVLVFDSNFEQWETGDSNGG